jgi:hypothetical protein
MSTYSTNLKIELITTGTQAGTWGNTTNVNLGTLIEQAIAGYTSYACTGGTDTLTMADGASDTARNMYIKLTGTGGGTLVVPGTNPNANTKLYFIQNGTGSGAVTVKVSGQTGVSVPNGAKIVLFCNGADVIDATNYMSSLTLGAALPVTSGGTGVTTSTGSGANVLATSPTLVTPALGTPTALVGTNITGTAAGLSIGGNAATATSATTATSAGAITNSGGWSVTPSGTTLYFNYNGTNVAKLDSSGNLTTKANITAYGTV